MNVMEVAKTRNKIVILCYERQLRELRLALEDELKSTSSSKDERSKKAAALKSELRFLEGKKHRFVQTQAKIQNCLEGEAVCRYWMQTNKKAKPQDMLYALRKPLSVAMEPTNLYEKKLTENGGASTKLPQQPTEGKTSSGGRFTTGED